jgi:hypothetical protein
MERIQWLAVARGDLGDSVHNAGERGEDLTDFPEMFEPIIIAFSVAVVAHHIGQAERAQYIAHARHASTARAISLGVARFARCSKFKVQCSTLKPGKAVMNTTIE